LAYTVMRTGGLVSDGSSGGGLRIGDVDLAVCDDVSVEDVYRFATEALTLPEAEGRLFSLCPSPEYKESLTQLRLRGYERRDEVRALLTGKMPEPAADALSDAEGAPVAEEEPELVMRSTEEMEAERTDELRMLLKKAKERGEKVAAEMKFAEEEAKQQREEAQRYYSAPGSQPGAP